MKADKNLKKNADWGKSILPRQSTSKKQNNNKKEQDQHKIRERSYANSTMQGLTDEPYAPKLIDARRLSAKHPTKIESVMFKDRLYNKETSTFIIVSLLVQRVRALACSRSFSTNTTHIKEGPLTRRNYATLICIH